MIGQISAPRLKGYHFPRSIISYAVWADHRFALSLRDVEDLLAERGIIVSYETIHRRHLTPETPETRRRIRPIERFCKQHGSMTSAVSATLDLCSTT